jgi:uncharacterized protein
MCEDMKLDAAILTLVCASAAAAQDHLPIIDMHLHAQAISDWGVEPPVGICAPFDYFRVRDPAQPYASFFEEFYLKGPPCSDPVWSPSTDEAIMRQTMEIMQRRNIYGVLSGPTDRVASWRAAAPGRFMAGLHFILDAENHVTPDSLRQLVAEGMVEVFGEISNAYDGIAPDDPRMRPYWALAEELDNPVGIHVGGSPPGEPYAGYGARASLESPLTVEEVLVRHPRMRVYLMHAGYPMLDDLLAVLSMHPHVHVDIGAIVFTLPRPEFYRYLQRIVEAGFVHRVMFGSDQMVWPAVIERSIAVIEEAPFLSEEHKRAILYGNAARFLRLSDEEIARHHGR